ncbi:MAG: hypothetical protein GEU99_22135 [Luteitalea sp.]|nr:hypothetical protein [Luteitalea sp.]
MADEVGWKGGEMSAAVTPMSTASSVKFVCSFWAGAFLLLTVDVGMLLAQSPLSTIRGTVLDETRAVVPGVDISVTNVTTNVLVRSVVSNDDGNFEVPDLQPGTYRLRAELSGFQTFVADSIVLGSAQTRRIDVLLAIGEATEEVTVEAGAGVITTESGSITTGVSGEVYKDAPLVDIYPGPLSMLSTLPGVQGNGWNVSISGQTTSQISDAVDGIANDRTGAQGANMNMYEEVTVTTVNNTADQSRVASFNAISKSGSNTFHGELWFKHVNSAVNARDFFEPEKTPFLLHEWQAEASGPIFRNKTFFYGAWFSERFPKGSFQRATAPTSRMRQGDFSQLSQTLRDPLTGQPFPANVIPTQRLNPTAQRVQELYIPEANLGGADTLTNNLGFDFPYPDDKFKTDIISYRIDHQLTDNNTLSFRHHFNNVPYVLAQELPAFSWTRKRSYSRAVLSNTHVFSSALVNTFRFGWNGNYMIDGEQVDGWSPLQGQEAVAATGLEGVNPRGLSAQGFPNIDISGLSSLRTTAGGVRDDHFDFQWDNSLTWAIDRHVLKFGAQVFKYNDFDALVGDGTFGEFDFDGSFTGIGYADFLLGLPNSSTRLDPLTPREQSQYELGLFVMDTFKVTPQLTLDYGVRWDYFSAPTYKDGLQYSWDPATGNVVVPEPALSAVSPLYSPNINVVTGQVVPESDLGNIRPRLGVAYRFASDWVLRGGYGAFTERIEYFSRAEGGGPFEISETYFNRIENGQPLFAFPNPFPSTLAAAAIPSQNVNGYPLKTSHGTIHQFNVSLERQIGQLGLRGSYIGSRSTDLNYSLNINKPQPSLEPFDDSRRPFPQFVNTSVVREDGAASYNALQLEANRRAGAIVFNAHYTLASNLANFRNLENPYDVTRHWANDDYTPRHRAVVTTTFELPWGRGRTYLSDASALVDQLIGGWRLMTMSYFATGPHFSPSFSGSDPSNTNTFGGLPDRIGDGNLPRGERTVDRWFDPSAFVEPPPGRFGNSAPNALVGPGMNVHHLSLAKNFYVRQRVSATLTLAASNIFNHPHFQNPRDDISTPNPGELFEGIPDWMAEKHGSRKLQAKLRIGW